MSKTIVEKLSQLYDETISDMDKGQVPFIHDSGLLNMIVEVCSYNRNKAPIRFLMSCLAAKIDRPGIDIRKPYTQIGGDDSFSGRNYDENPVQAIITKYNLPCNPTTAYLTPAFRNRNEIMVPGLRMEGRPPALYQNALQLLDAVYNDTITPENLLKEIYCQLTIIKQQSERRITELIAKLGSSLDAQPLSSEQIVTLLQQHLSSNNASRLPTLIVAAAYQSVSDLIGETARKLNAHNAADSQTGAFGDVEITLNDENNIVTSYEMKDKAVTSYDIDIALNKIAAHEMRVDNYIFITTDIIDPLVEEYAKGLYDETGVEFAILNCVGFIKHFLHFFHRRRTTFLNTYQTLVLAEPNSSVGQPLKEAFLALRTAAETK